MRFTPLFTEAARQFFTRALAGATSPTEVTTDLASAYPRIVEDMLPGAPHITVRYANNPVEADHGRLRARLRPDARMKKDRSLRIIATGHAFSQNLRRGQLPNSAPTPPPLIGWRSRSPSSPSRSDQPGRSAASGRPPFDQRNSASRNHGRERRCDATVPGTTGSSTKRAHSYSAGEEPALRGPAVRARRHPRLGPRRRRPT